jgi:hypothetical protein
VLQHCTQLFNRIALQRGSAAGRQQSTPLQLLAALPKVTSSTTRKVKQPACLVAAGTESRMRQRNKPAQLEQEAKWNGLMLKPATLKLEDAAH